MCHCGGSQYSLPEPGDSHHDTLDEESLHTHPTQATQHDQTYLRERQTQVLR